jgi:hypothetical protein
VTYDPCFRKNGTAIPVNFSAGIAADTDTTVSESTFLYAGNEHYVSLCAETSLWLYEIKTEKERAVSERKGPHASALAAPISTRQKPRNSYKVSRYDYLLFPHALFRPFHVRARMINLARELCASKYGSQFVSVIRRRLIV